MKRYNRYVRQAQKRRSAELRTNPVSYPAVPVEQLKFEPPLTKQELKRIRFGFTSQT